MESVNSIAQLEAIHHERMQLQLRLERVVRSARQEGKSWERIAAAIGMTKQACWEKYRYLDKFLA